MLGSDWDLDAVVAQLRATPQRQIGAALLDQRVIAGRGNIWAYRGVFCHRGATLDARGRRT